MAKWEVEVFDSTVYVGIEADTAEEAKSIAWDWFQERKPDFVVRRMSEKS